MKKISLVLVAALLFFASNVNASTTDANKPKSLSAQIQEMFKSHSFAIKEGDLFAQVRFTLNKEGEIVVLSVDTDNDILEGFVKGKLNYKKVDIEDIAEGKMYTVSVRITA